MFVFHMMRLRIGDAAFWAALRDIYSTRLYKRTSWGHFMDAFAEHGGLSRNEVRTFHDQWITRPGALQLAMDRPRVVSTKGHSLVAGILTQKSPRFKVHLPVEVTGATANRRETVYLGDATAKFSIRMQEAPRKVVADPDFDVFRLLYPEEIPATVNVIKGSSALVAVLAEDSHETWAEIFRGLLIGLNHGGRRIWSENRFAAADIAGKDIIFFGMPKQKRGRTMLSELGDTVALSSSAFRAGKGISSRNADTLFAVFKSKQRLVAVFLPVEGIDFGTVMRTARKITHYGRYGRLSFKGGVNTGKGVGEVSGSPLSLIWGTNHDEALWFSNVAISIPVEARHPSSGRGNYHMGRRC